LERRVVLLPCLLHVLLPRYHRFLGAGLHLNRLSHSRGPAHGGPVGIWAYNCDRALLQFNKSHRNHSNNQADGGGFDLDGGTTNSVMRYNVSWGNDGYGFQLWDFFWGEFRNNRVHHNVSLMDCERWRNFGAFVVFGRVMSEVVQCKLLDF